MIDEHSSLTDVAGAVAAALRELAYDPVVVGGSAATLHAPEAYRSHDVDMVVIGGIDRGDAVVAAMAKLGFVFQNHMFFHECNPYTVEFQHSPVAIAGDVVSDFAEVETPYGPVRVLHAADVVNDRLNKAVAYEDPESFEVAVAVARIKGIDPARVQEFIERQDVGVYHERFRAALERLIRRLGAEARELSPIGFSTAFRSRFAVPPSVETAQAVARGIQALLDEERADIKSVLDGVRVFASPMISIDDEDPTMVRMTLMVATKRSIPPVERFALAHALVEHARARMALFPELVDVPDDGPPPVASAGV